jgi:DNA-directed RNA polymerase specialized sigma24 family protein
MKHDPSSQTVDDYVDVSPDEFDGMAGLLNLPRAVPMSDAFDVRAPDDVEEAIIHSENRARIRAAIEGFLKTLTPRQRFVIWCLLWRGMSQAHVARILRTSRAAITQLLNRVYEKGRRALGGVRDAM